MPDKGPQPCSLPPPLAVEPGAFAARVQHDAVRAAWPIPLPGRPQLSAVIATRRTGAVGGPALGGKLLEHGVVVGWHARAVAAAGRSAPQAIGDWAGVVGESLRGGLFRGGIAFATRFRFSTRPSVQTSMAVGQVGIFRSVYGR